MSSIGEFVASLERVKIYTASCEGLHRRIQWLLAALEENSFYMEPDETLQATQTLDGMLLKIIRRLDEWGNLTLLETFVRRTEIQSTLRSISEDLGILASQLQLVIGPGFHSSPAELAHLDIQDSLEMKGILLYLAGRPEELKALTQGSFTPSDCQNLAKALQTDIRDEDVTVNERGKLADALWRLVTWSNMPLPLMDLTAEVHPSEDQTPLWQGEFTEAFAGKWSGNHVVLTVSKALNESKTARKALEESISIWRNLRHNNIQHIWGSIRLNGDLYTVGPCMKHWNLDLYLDSGPHIDRFNLVTNLATGLEFLHKQTPPITVGAITTIGVHISEKGKPCIANYAVFPMILQLVHDGIFSCTSANIRCFAPELFLKKRAEITPRSDVYGFAIICYQILTGVQIHQNVPEDQLVTFIREGRPPERPDTELSLRWLFDELWELLTKCWSLDPTSRPSMSTVVASLRVLDRARRDGSTTITRTIVPSRNGDGPMSSLRISATRHKKNIHDSFIQYSPSGGIISGTLSGLVRLMLSSDTVGLSNDISDTLFYMFRAFTTPEILLDTVESQYHEIFSNAVSAEARIATCFDLLNFLETWLRHDWSYIPSKILIEQLKNLVGSINTPLAAPTLVDRVKSLIQIVEEWGETSMSSGSSSLTITPGSSSPFDLEGMSPRSLACALAYIQSELFDNILPPDFVQWSRNIYSRTGRNNISVFIERCNQIAHWITQSILETTDLRRRAEIVEFFINTSSECLALGDYSSISAIVAGLRSSFVRKLTVTWKCISDRAQRTLQSMELIFDPKRNFKAYRKSITSRNKPYIPHLGINLRDVKLLFALASQPVASDEHEDSIPFAQYQNLYRHLIGIIMKPEHYATFQENCRSDVSSSLDHTLRHTAVNDISFRELEQCSAELVATERRLQPRKIPEFRPKLFGHDHKKGAPDESRARSPGSTDGSDSEHTHTRQLPLRVKDLSRDVVKLHEHSITGGGFCDVYLGEARFSNKVERVAMKMLRVGAGEQKIKKSFYREVETWIRVRHPFVLPFYGVSEQNGRFYMISPWAENGNALQYLQAYPNASRRKLLWQTSDALRYLHSGTDSPRIVHGDIKAENILITDMGDVMLADFGLARLVDTIAAITATSTNFGGSSRFMAPELLIPETGSSDLEGGCVRTTRSDVWAFGCLMLQIFTGHRPFNHLTMEPQVLLAIVHREKPSPRPPSHEAVRRGFDEYLWELTLECWEFEPEHRPEMKVVSAHLRDSRYRLQTSDLI